MSLGLIVDGAGCHGQVVADAALGETAGPSGIINTACALDRCSIVAAGPPVTESVPPGATLAGLPASLFIPRAA